MVHDTVTPSPENIAAPLLDWWRKHGRKDLPWQIDPTPFRVWVSEIMLQQTQVVTVEQYYDRFLTAFPTVHALANASADEVLHLWSGLGYYARARNLHKAAGIVRDNFSGELPRDIDSLESLPGIGRSTAGAILALANDQSFPILDGNAKRVLARYFGVAGWPGKSDINRKLWALAEGSTPKKNAATYTQAIMDLGSVVCTRRKAACHVCPLAKQCIALNNDQVAEIPASQPKRSRPEKQIVLIMAVLDDEAILLCKRPNNGIWGGLWGFPETSDVAGVTNWCEQQVGRAPDSIKIRSQFRHNFTHFDLDMTPVEAHFEKAANRAMDSDQWLWYKLGDPPAIGLAKPISQLLKSMTEL
jgi:A/G-specific adenine glycosylase